MARNGFRRRVVAVFRRGSEVKMRERSTDNNASTVTSSSEAGVVMILLAIFLVAVASVLALLIDGGRLSNSSTEKRMSAEIAVSAALESYRNFDPTSDASLGANPNPSDLYHARLRAAFRRAEEVIAFDANSLTTDRKDAQLSLGDDLLSDGSGALSERSNDVVGVLTPGRFFTEEPGGEDGCQTYAPNGSDCPCNGGKWEGACFLANDASATSLTAFDLTLRSKDDEGMSLLFAPVMNFLLNGDKGQQQFALSERARATLQARVNIFAIDLSRSVSFDTHVPITNARDNLGTAAEYVFELDTAAGPGCLPSNGNPCIGNNTCRFRFPEYPSQDIWEALPPTRVGQPLGPKTQHYQDDYACFQIDGREYLVDISIHDLADGTRYYGPEPLNNILSGLHEALLEVKTKTVPGDKIGIFAFDEVDNWLAEREMPPTNIFEDPSTWGDMEDITNISLLDGAPPSAAGVPRARYFDPSNAALQKRLLVKKFFPIPNADTDITFGVYQAAQLLPEGLTNADLQVTMFSDFVNSCKSADYRFLKPGDPVELADRQCLQPNVTEDIQYSPQNNSWGYFNGGMTEAVMMVSSSPNLPLQDWQIDQRDSVMEFSKWKTYAERGIRFNAFMFGEFVEPHILLKPSMTDSTKCMDDKDARRHNRDFVAGPAREYWNPWDSQRCIFYRQAVEECKASGVSRLVHHMVASTGGYFLPMRPPCSISDLNAQATLSTWGVNDTNCSEGKLEDALDQNVCAPFNPSSATGSVLDPAIGDYGPLGPLVTELDTAGIVETSWGSVKYEAPPHTYEFYDQEYTAAHGEKATRIVCDTKCRSFEQQIEDVIREMYNTNPYTLVREDL